MEPVLPHSLEAERAVLGAVLVDPRAWPVAASALRPPDFYRQAHQRAFDAIAAVVGRGATPDLLTVAEELATRGQLDDVGGRAYLSSMADGMPRSANVGDYAEIVAEKARLRALWAVGQQLIESAHEGQASTQVADRAVMELVETIGAPRGRLVQADEAVREYAAALSDGPAGARVPFGYADLDDLTSGCRPGDLVIVAGRPSVGKSSWALGAAEAMAAAGQPAVFFSLEMERRALAARLLAWRSGVSSHKLERGAATDDDYRRVSDAVCAEGAAPLLIEDTAQTVAEIGAWCRRAKQAGGLACAVVDYLQMLVPDRRRDSEEADVASISRSLKRLAKDLKVAVVALSQLSRAPEGRRDKRPHLSDLRGSGALEQDCDMAVLLFREELYKPTDENRGIAECIVAKHRSGPTGVVRLQFSAELAQFHDLAYGR